jgi:hypothetical protein
MILYRHDITSKQFPQAILLASDFGISARRREGIGIASVWDSGGSMNGSLIYHQAQFIGAGAAQPGA